MKLLEVCVDSFLSAQRAIAGGADRLELCGVLAAGGITPPVSLIEQCCALAPNRVMVMIRPRAGSFSYTSEELLGMERDIHVARNSGARGVVFGILHDDFTLHIEATRRLCEAAHGLDITFHRAFDLIADKTEALERLVELGIPRVLTSGGAMMAEAGAAVLTELVRQAAGRIVVMPGSGVRPANLLTLDRQIRAAEYHASARRAPAKPTECGSRRWQVAESMAATEQPECDEATVRELRGILDGIES
ncbi:MAG: copper homeostasis protein CutC [Pirellulales bacterium]